MARPRKTLDVGQLERLAWVGCTAQEIAAVVGCGVSLLRARPEFAASIKRGRIRGQASLRRMQWRAARRGNVTALIWLGKVLLGQREPVVHTLEGPGWERVQAERAAVTAIIADPEARASARQLQDRLSALRAGQGNGSQTGGDGDGDGSED